MGKDPLRGRVGNLLGVPGVRDLFREEEEEEREEEGSEVVRGGEGCDCSAG